MSRLFLQSIFRNPASIPTRLSSYAKATKMARAFHAIADTTPQDVARALMQQEQDVNLARARIQSMLQFLSETDDALGQMTR